MTNSCRKCHRSSPNRDGWYTVHEYQTDSLDIFSMCPSCYKNLALINQKEAMVEAIEAIRLSHSDPAIKMGMEMMKRWCVEAVQNAPYEAS